MLAIVGASGKIGFATLSALLEYNLHPVSQIIACTSSSPGSPTWQKLSNTGVHVRHGDFADQGSLLKAFSGAEALYLVSTPRIELDYNNAPNGKGREAHHIAAINAAQEAGVRHIYYTSLAFGRPSTAGVMRAHIRTEEYLENLTNGTTWTILREGLYNESWPLYLGYFDVPNDKRDMVTVAGDGLLNWTSIRDLGLGTALVITASRDEYSGKTLYLSTQKNVMNLADVAKLVGVARGKFLSLNVLSQKGYEQHYIEEKGIDAQAVEWWSSSYGAVEAGETHIEDSILDGLLSSKNVVPRSMQDTIREMMA